MKSRYLIFILLFNNLIFNNLYSQIKVSQKENDKDKLYSAQQISDPIQQLKKSFQTSWNKTFVDFTDNTTYLLAGIGWSKQSITTGGYSSSFNYNLSDINSNSFKPGYFAGLRVDGKYKKIHNYSFGMVLNDLVTGNNYKDSKSLTPFVGSFSNFKADDRFLNLSIVAHYKNLLTISDTSKYKFYLVVGPSLDTRLLEQSANNLVNSNYSRFLLRADVGFEFENKNFYTLFLHYKQGLTSFTKSPISANINSIEFGMMVKASDLF